MKTIIRTFILLLIALPQTNSAFANLSVQTLRASHSRSYSLLYDTDGRFPKLKGETFWDVNHWLFSAQMNTINSPMVQYDAFGENPDPVVDRATTLDLAFSLYMMDRLQAGLDLPISAIAIDQTETGYGLGDLRLFTKYNILTSNPLFNLSAVAEFYAPTGKGNTFASNDVFGFGVGVIVERDFDFIRVAGNAVFRYFSGAGYETLDTARTLFLGLGAFLPIGQRFGLNVEGTTNALLGSNQGNLQGDLYFGGHINIFTGGDLNLGGAIGNQSNEGSYSFRVVAGLKLYTDEPDRTITERLIVKTEKDCGNVLRTAKFPARRLTQLELDTHSELPYRSTKKHPLAKLQIGQVTAITKTGLRYVKDGQVVFAVDLPGLPNPPVLVNIEQLLLKMSVTKVSKDRYTDTEILCLIEQRICSGELYTSSSWKPNINEVFFGGAATPNDFFARQYLQSEVGSIDKLKLYSSELSIPLDKLLENSSIPDVTSLILQQSNKKNKTPLKTLFFSVADDTYVSNQASIEISYTENTCERAANQ